MSGRSFYSDAVVNAEATPLIALYAGGKLIIYDGTAPVDANTALGGGNHVLATHTLGNPAFTGPVAGLLTAAAIAAVTIARSGVANFFRLFAADGTSDCVQGNVANQTVTLTSAVLVNDVSIAVSALTLPLYAGQDLVFNDGGVLKVISVTANAAAGATSVTCSAAAAAIANAKTASGCAVVASPNYQQNAQSAVSAFTLQVSESGT